MAEFGEPLSGRELEVLRCVASGAANKEIAAELHISQNTVKVHLRNVYTKLGVASRTEATTVALQQGLLTIPGTETLPPPPKPDTEQETESMPLAETAVPAAQPRRFSWPMIGLGVVTVTAVLLAAIFGLRAANTQTDPTPTPEPFTEQRIEETQWFHSRPLPNGRAGMAVAALGLNVYVIGGDTTDGVV
ncbi:MAG: response regulator transcription factor, partial [Anaerolineae bacterium]